jgi:hypothetical protein
MPSNSLSLPPMWQKDSNQFSGEHNIELNEKITQVQLDHLTEVRTINKGNEWASFLQGGSPKKPYLQAEGRLKKKPKTIHVSTGQRRVHLG